MDYVVASIIVGFLSFSTEIKGKPAALDKHAEPCKDPLDCLHGVLMHGDEKAGDSHNTEDSYLKFKPLLDTGQKEKAGPEHADEMLHGIMHGGESFDKKHHQNEEKKISPEKPHQKQGPRDIGEHMHGVLMHGDTAPGKDHSKEDVRKDIDKGSIQPLDSDKMMHGVLMHGDAKHEHGQETGSEVNALRGPEDMSQKMHAFMHNGEYVNHELESKIDRVGKVDIGPKSDDLHGILMHGDSEAGHDHSKEHAISKGKPFKFDKEALKKLNIDEDILKAVSLENIVEDLKDYEEWKKEKRNDPYNSGSSPRFVSDSVLSDIETMKRRYLSRARKIGGKAIGITAEEANANLDPRALDHGNEDARHELELVGSTEPLNSRHKVFKDRN